MPDPGSSSLDLLSPTPRVNQLQQPVTIGVRYNQTVPLFLSFLFPALLIGPAVIWAKGRVGGASESYWKWWTKILNIVALFVGAAGARAYFGTRVLGSDSYGSELFDRFPLAWVITDEWYLAASGTVSAFVAAALASSLIGDAARGGTDKKAADGARGRIRA